MTKINSQLTTQMQQPLWKRWLSYIVSQPIEHASSAYNAYLRVVLSRGRYQLQTENAIYSYGDLYDNFSKVFEKLDLDKMNIRRVLILGFGLGSIPYMLEKTFRKNYAYTAVEIDEEVVNLAKKYVLPSIKAKIDFQIMDANDFAEFSDEQFDMICMDVFIDDVVPTQLEQEAFLLNLKKMLAPNGILLYNRLSFFQKDRVNTEEFFQSVFKHVFTEGVFLDVKGNYILLNRADFLKKT